MSSTLTAARKPVFFLFSNHFIINKSARPFVSPQAHTKFDWPYRMHQELQIMCVCMCARVYVWVQVLPFPVSTALPDRAWKNSNFVHPNVKCVIAEVQWTTRTVSKAMSGLPCRCPQLLWLTTFNCKHGIIMLQIMYEALIIPTYHASKVHGIQDIGWA